MSFCDNTAAMPPAGNYYTTKKMYYLALHKDESQWAPTTPYSAKCRRHHSRVLCDEPQTINPLTSKHNNSPF